MHTYDMSANIKFEIADLSCIVYIQFVNISKCLSAVVSSVSSSQLISIPCKYYVSKYKHFLKRTITWMFSSCLNYLWFDFINLCPSLKYIWASFGNNHPPTHIWILNKKRGFKTICHLRMCMLLVWCVVCCLAFFSLSLLWQFHFRHQLFGRWNLIQICRIRYTYSATNSNVVGWLKSCQFIWN